MQNGIARQIFSRVMSALKHGDSSYTVFKHMGKTAAINHVWENRRQLFENYLSAADKLEFCQKLPWVGPITKFHLAKNFGLQVSKPDVHLARLAALHQTTAQELCADLARKTGYKIATIDTILWRACAVGILNSRIGIRNQEKVRCQSSDSVTS